MSWTLRAEGLAKGFTLHLRGGMQIPVLRDAGMEVAPGECVALSGPSGAGKSTLMRLLHGNYGADAGRILVRRADGTVTDLAVAPAARGDRAAPRHGRICLPVPARHPPRAGAGRGGGAPGRPRRPA